MIWNNAIGKILGTFDRKNRVGPRFCGTQDKIVFYLANLFRRLIHSLKIDAWKKWQATKKVLGILTNYKWFFRFFRRRTYVQIYHLSSHLLPIWIFDGLLTSNSETPRAFAPLGPSPSAGLEGKTERIACDSSGPTRTVKPRRNGRRLMFGKKSRVIVGNNKYCFFRANFLFLFLYRPSRRVCTRLYHGKIRTSGSHETWYFLRLSASRHDDDADDDDKTVNRRPTGEIGTHSYYCRERVRRPTVVWSPRRSTPSPITELVSDR